MDSKWLPNAELTSSGRPVLQPGEVECFTLSSVDLESETNSTLPTLRSGLLILTTHRLLWIPNATSPFYASGIPLKSVSHIFSINMPIKSIGSPKVRFQVFASPEGKVDGHISNSAVMITFVLTGNSDPDAFLVKFWEAWGGRAWENSPQERPSGSNSDEDIEKNRKNSTSSKHLQNIKFLDPGVGVAKEAPGGGSHGIPEQENREIYLSDKDLCIKCQKGGRLLVCSDVCCPLAFHKECMPQTLTINSMDNFYCSYCSYKRAFLRTSKTRKALLLAKKNLSLFLEKSSTNTKMQKAPEAASLPIILEETTCDETAKHLNENGPSVHSGQLENDQEVERATQVDENQEVGERFDAKPDDVGHQIERAIHVDEQQEEAKEPNIPTQLESLANSSRKRKCDDKRTEMQEHDLEPSSRLRKRKLTSSNEINIEEKNIIADTFKKKQNSSSGVEKRSVEHKVEIPTSSKIRSRSVEQKEKTPTTVKTRSRIVEQKEKTPTTVKTRSRSVEQKEKTPTTVKTRSRTVEQEEVADSMESSTMESSHNVEHKDKTTSNESSNESKPHHFRFPQKKRKKCPWRVEEEQILKEGVEKFSTKIKRNIPWKKLLEFGSHVFDNNRTARDLKDKWKNLQA